MFSKQDKKIKEILKQDKIISSKANKTIDNVLEEIKLHKIEQEQNKKELYIIKFNSSYIKFIISLTSIMTVFVGSNVYANYLGYDNIFFLIKEKTIQKSIDNIFVDEQIVLSYKTFNISKDIKMQINHLDIYENSSILHCKLIGKQEQLDFCVIDEKTNKVLGKKKNINLKDNEIDFDIYLDKIIKENNLVVEIRDQYNHLQKTVKIDLQNKIIEAITNNEDMKQISQIQLFNKLKQQLKQETDKDITILKVTDIFYERGKYSVKFVYVCLDETELSNISESFDDFSFASATFYLDNYDNIIITNIEDEIKDN